MEKWEFELVKERIQKEYWINIDGKIIRYKGSLRNADNYPSLHYEIAEQLYPNIEDPDDYLYNLGWISMGSACGRKISKEPSQAQINTLFDLGFRRLREDNGTLYEF